MTNKLSSTNESRRETPGRTIQPALPQSYGLNSVVQRSITTTGRNRAAI